ncbi:MAG: class I SAM-dependent methyltransferase [Sphingomonadaceae bacterium]|nr:class I SAM-dependent methyltransferase [Sphingomonadaceae bacterium]
MKLLHAVAICALLISAPSHAGSAARAKKAVAAAISDPARPADDVKRDDARKPADILEFAQVKPRDKVIDFIMGGGYFSRLLARTVGPKGKVFAYQPAEFISFRAQYGVDQKTVADAYPNVAPLSGPLGTLAFPEAVDLIFTAQNYHDLHLAAFPAGLADKVDAALFNALKRGGVLLVIDHAAAAGSGTRDSNALHRIDPATVRAELEKAGFRFEGESSLLRNADDPHTALVFDPAIRGKTDQFIYRFRKPR